ncbi:hypothetical protein K469DRAFT_674816 [Zopfia rhizophila CBS 207.26]|uniref:Uncharacterized protein n=1 Tax=Zopfia rhizophila CBS 207.26 TaxID=1314779 RepID=A0A6A6DIX9_9PEZI|nr:hypothetical protein K469DRAFT_674816 [Zopfia rhizophila CBS 207.26]
MPTVIPSAQKLPLAVRKNVRDEYENKKADFEEELSSILGKPWKIDINPNAIWVYTEEGGCGRTSLDSCLSSYVSGAIDNIKSFIDEHHDLGKDEINTVCAAHTLTFEFDESGKIHYSGCDIHNGRLRMLFQEKYLGYNVHYALQKLEDALSAATPDAALSYTARHSIAEYWDAKLPELKEMIVKQLNNPAIKIDPNWEEVYAALKASKSVQENWPEWEKTLGRVMMTYFNDGFAYQLHCNKFESDDMLQEGFAEAVHKGEVKFRVVKKLIKDSYCEPVVEDGVLYLQTIPEEWTTNCYYIASNIVDVL